MSQNSEFSEFSSDELSDENDENFSVCMITNDPMQQDNVENSDEELSLVPYKHMPVINFAFRATPLILEPCACPVQNDFGPAPSSEIFVTQQQAQYILDGLRQVVAAINERLHEIKQWHGELDRKSEHHFSQVQGVVDLIGQQFQVVQKNDEILFNEGSRQGQLLSAHLMPLGYRVKKFEEQIVQFNDRILALESFLSKKPSESPEKISREIQGLVDVQEARIAQVREDILRECHQKFSPNQHPSEIFETRIAQVREEILRGCQQQISANPHATEIAGILAHITQFDNDLKTAAEMMKEMRDGLAAQKLRIDELERTKVPPLP